jgi:hypothetical protein
MTTMKQTAREKLLGRFESSKKSGELKDIKFCLGGDVHETTVEYVCDEVNRVLDAVADGAPMVAQRWNDSNRP